MTKKQAQQWNKMRDTLIEITKYASTDRLHRTAEKEYGVSGSEAIEMAYENIQATAKFGVKGVKAIKVQL